MVQCCGGGGGRRRNGSRAYFSYVYNFFHNSFFFLACHSLNMQHQTNSFIEKNVYFMHIQTKQIVDTSSHTGSVSISTRKRNPHFSRTRFAFFAALSRELMIFIQIFSVAFPAVGYQYVLCVSFSASCEATKKKYISPVGRVFILIEKSVKEFTCTAEFTENLMLEANYAVF